MRPAKHYIISYDKETSPVVEFDYIDDLFTHDLMYRADAALATSQANVEGCAYTMGTVGNGGKVHIESSGVVISGHHLDERFELKAARAMVEMGLLPAGQVSIGAGQGDGEIFSMSYAGRGLKVRPTWGSDYRVTGENGESLGWFTMEALRALVASK